MRDGRFSSFVAIDWSGARGERLEGIAIAVADRDGGPPVLVEPPARGWSRAEVLALLRDELAPGSLVGLDLGISLPFADCDAFFPGWDRSPAEARGLWRLVDEICADDPHFAAQNFVEHEQAGRYFRRHTRREGTVEGDRFGCDNAAQRSGRMRLTEHRQARQGCRPCSNFNLVGASQVGKSSLTGMRVLHALEGAVPVWPIDPLPGEGSVIVEIYTAISSIAAQRRAGRSKIRDHADLARALAVLGSPAVNGSGPIDDHSADALLTAAWLRANAHRPELWSPAGLTPEIARTEGWTFGVA